jgi:hypothetical protein
VKHLLVGCSFTDPLWQKAVPWSIEYSKTHPSYIVAKAGMGIRGICTEALYFLKNLDNVNRVVIVLPNLWRLDIEADEETYISNAMVDLLEADPEIKTTIPATRKWIVSGGLRYLKGTEQAPTLDFLYKHQGFLVITKEHLRALTMLINYCKMHNIEYYISTIQDPLDQLTGLDYISNNINELLEEVEYKDWIRFDGKFIDQYLGHPDHPTTEEHQDLCKQILNHINKGNNHGKTI